MRTLRAASPMARGALLALAAAVLFGASTPWVRRFGQGASAFATAALLYAGAALGSAHLRASADEPAVARSHLRRLALVALLGAAIGPACLAFGLQRSGAIAASLLLNLEAVLTLLLARVFYREPVGARVVIASALMVAGGALLAIRAAAGGGAGALGLLAIAAATLAWALDNTLTRALADLDPRAVVFWKSLLGAALSTAAAVAIPDRWPAPAAALGLLACGAAGYGLSLRLYLRAQRLLGAGRTGSLFALGPFVGAVAAMALGERAGGALVVGAGALFAIAVWLHVTEHHEHPHRHAPMEHEHAHRHDDGHHAHAHVPPIVGAHSHVHRHEPVEHAHPHGVDVHHRHQHG